jgi:hypothetical protein
MSRNRLLSALRRLADQPVPVRRQRLRERFLDPLWRARDAAIPSLTSRGPGHLEALLAAPLAAAPSDAGLWAALALRYLGRRFDLLGSGWVRVAHGERFAGFDGYGFAPRLAPEVDVDGAWLHGRVDDTNLSVCRRVWALLPAGHEPIDWQVDFRSGYRWSERTWYSDLQFGDRTGADVKVPWELGRMQHVVHLSLAHAAARAGAPGFLAAETYRDAVRAHILDFMAQNPPRFGVQWGCPMDVGMRAVSWLLARDLLLAAGAELDEPFERALCASVRAHGVHVASHLEWSPRRGNHYLANLACLAVIGAHYRDDAGDDWLRFAGDELGAEVAFQFGADGGHREGSTSYHRFAAEMVVYALVFTEAARRRGRAVAAPSPRTLRAVARMAELSEGLAHEGGRVPQIGDADDGLFVDLDPRFADDVALVRRHDDHRPMIAAARALLGDSPEAGFLGARLVAALCGPDVGRGAREESSPAHAPATQAVVGDRGALARVGRHLEELPHRAYRIALPPGALAGGVALRGFPDFGAYAFRWHDGYLLVRCGAFGERGNYGHNHCDQLALELWVAGEPWVRDPGTYVYTASPAERDRYRSVRAHWAPRPEGDAEPARLGGPFAFDSSGGDGHCLFAGPEGFLGYHDGFGARVWRLLRFEADVIEVRDVSEGAALTELPVPAPSLDYGPSYSPSYGRRER